MSAAVAPATADLALATRGLVKRFGSRTALAGLDLSVPSGVVYGFLGPNGAGKTTTMRLLTGLIHPDAGTIEVLGRPFGRGDRKRLFEVGALVESPAFYPYLSARENLRSLAATGAKVPRNRPDELLETVGLSDRAGDKVSGYSLGMKQRLGIAAALLSDPRLLLLDEPANGLDPAGIVAMRDTLRNLAASGKTVFVSSHLLAEVQQLADVVGIIANGKLLREGPIQAMLASEGHVRVRVDPTEAAAAGSATEALTGAGSVTTTIEPDGAWLSVRFEPARAAEVNRALASAGIYASRVEARYRPRVTVPGADRRAGIRRGARETGGRTGWLERGRLVRIFRAGIRKLIRRPASFVTLGILVALIALVFLAVGATAKTTASRPGGGQALLLLTFPDAYRYVLSFILGLGGLLAVIYGAAIAGSEWTWGTLKLAVARGESRSRYIVLTFASVAILIGIGLLVTFVVGVIMAIIGANLAGVSTAGVSNSDAISSLPNELARSWLGIAEEGALGFAIATIARSQLAGIGAGIALYFGEQFASLFLPDVVKYLPFNSASAVVGAPPGNGSTVPVLEPNVALVVVLVWLIGALVVSALFTERADVGG